MDSDDAEAGKLGSVAIRRESPGRRKFAALLLIHTLLTGACVVLCFYTLHKPVEPTWRDRGIYLNMKRGSGQGPLNFTVTWSNGMELNGESNVNVTFPGPYIFYICVSLVGNNGYKENLTMKQGNTKTSIELQASPTSSTYVRHERLVSLSENDVVTFEFNLSNSNVKLKELRVGLHYMLGTQHFDTPK